MPRVMVLLSGVWWIKVERPKVDWTVYLGPTWTPMYDGASTIVLNHSNWIVNATLSLSIFVGYPSANVVEPS